MVVVFEQDYLRELFESGHASDKNIVFSRILSNAIRSASSC